MSVRGFRLGGLWRPATICAVGLLSVAGASAGCGSSGSSKLPAKIGRGEGQLNLVARKGYARPEWVKPFERQTGCQVHTKSADGSGEMVSLMRRGGGRYDMVSASGDASLGLIKGGDVQPVNIALLPDWRNFIPQLKSPPSNTVDGKHYGVSSQWGPNVLLYNASKVRPAPTSWGAIYDKKFRGRVTAPDNPIQIADAALFLSKIQPAAGITDPYELTVKQLELAVLLLKSQKPLVKRYWSRTSDAVDLFKNGDATIGAARPYQTIALQDAKVPVKDLIPKEGATGWIDTWMLSSKAEHPNCAYMWMRYVSTPKLQAQQALSLGETPTNTKACAEMDKIQRGACKRYHADAPASYVDRIRFWKTPAADCGNGKTDCTDLSVWQEKWQEIQG